MGSWWSVLFCGCCSKRDLEREATETQAKQVELDKTAEDFRVMHKERQDLVRQWQASGRTMLPPLFFCPFGPCLTRQWGRAVSMSWAIPLPARTHRTSHVNVTTWLTIEAVHSVCRLNGLRVPPLLRLPCSAQDSLEVVKQRDEEIAKAAEEYALATERFRARKEALAEYAARVKQMLDENAEFEVKIAARARGIARQREEFIQAQAKLAEFKDEVRVCVCWLRVGCVCVLAYRRGGGAAFVHRCACTKVSKPDNWCWNSQVECWVVCAVL